MSTTVPEVHHTDTMELGAKLKRWYTSVSFWREVRDVTNDFGFGRSRGSYCKQRDAKRTNSVPSSLENCPSRQESVSIWRFLSRIKSRAWIRSMQLSIKYKATQCNITKKVQVRAEWTHFNCTKQNLKRITITKKQNQPFVYMVVFICRIQTKVRSWSN